MLLGQLPQARQEVVGRDQIATLALDRLDEDGGHALRRRDRAEQLLDARERVIGRHPARRGRKWCVKHLRKQRRKATALARLRGRERQRTESAAMEGTDEGDIARPARGIPGQLHRAFDRLGTRVREEHARRRPGQDPVLQPLRQLDLGLVVEVGAGHMQEVIRLVLDGRDHLGVRMARRHHRDAGCEVEEPIAVDVGHPATSAVIHDEWVGAREARRHGARIACDQLGRLGTRQWSLDLRLHGRQA